MKISERKHRLRTRGAIPVSQDSLARRTSVTGTARNRGARGTATTASTSRSSKNAPSARPRWQPSPNYQIAFGLAYMVFSPILILNNVTLLHAPHSKAHPGAFEFIMPIVFFAFGAWWFYRGFQARRRQRAGQAPMTRAAAANEASSPSSTQSPQSPPPAAKTGLFRRSAR